MSGWNCVHWLHRFHPAGGKFWSLPPWLREDHFPLPLEEQGQSTQVDESEASPPHRRSPQHSHLYEEYKQSKPTRGVQLGFTRSRIQIKTDHYHCKILQSAGSLDNVLPLQDSIQYLGTLWRPAEHNYTNHNLPNTAQPVQTHSERPDQKKRVQNHQKSEGI